MTCAARLISHTLPLLLLVAALPFPASVLATYGDLQTGPPDATAIEQRERLWANIAVLVVCIPGAFVLGQNGPWLLLLLIVSGRAPRIRRARRAARA